MEQAQHLVNEVAEVNIEFRYSSNAGYRDNRIAAAVSILKTEIEQHATQDDDPDGMNEFLNGDYTGHIYALIP